HTGSGSGCQHQRLTRAGFLGHCTDSGQTRPVKPALRVAWYRFRATFGRRWGGYLTITLLVGLVGGLALGAIAGARRTQSSYPRFMKSTNPSDLIVLRNDSATDDNRGDPDFLRRLARLPHVAR